MSPDPVFVKCCKRHQRRRQHQDEPEITAPLIIKRRRESLPSHGVCVCERETCHEGRKVSGTQVSSHQMPPVHSLRNESPDDDYEHERVLKCCRAGSTSPSFLSS